MDADWSHSPDYLPGLMAALDGGADLVIGSRYAPGGGVRDWGLLRRLVSRGGSVFARLVLRLVPHDLTGGFKAWQRAALESIDWQRVHAGGYVFQIETTYLASRAGARVVEVPIVFKDREVGTSKMSKTIIIEALQVVLQLRWEEMRGRGPAGIASTAAAGRTSTAGPTAAAGPAAAGPSAAANSPQAARPDDRPSG
jgi:dolichol-phosphate mannosyltransferase